MQTSLFGLQSLPGFQAINNHLVGTASGNVDHNDLYSGAANLLGAGRGTLGSYLLYGVTSNWLDAGLYNRGDVNPRQLTLLPVNPLDFPAIKGGINIVSNLVSTASRIANGASVPASLLIGLEHNGLNRPLAGLAQLAQGYATNSTGGKLISTNRDQTPGMSEMFSMANFSRLLGARPLDEAVALDAMYRAQMYTAKSEAQINAIGRAFKTDVMADGAASADEMADFAARYSAAGGDQRKFTSRFSRWTSEAKTSIANKVFRTYLSSPGAKNAMVEMGGRQLPDYLNTGNIGTSDQVSGGTDTGIGQ